MTAQQLLHHRHEPYRTELIGGRLHEMEPAGAQHGVVEGRIHLLLALHVEAANLGTTFVGDVGFHIASNPDTVRAPDVAFVATVYRSRDDILVLTADEPLALGDVVPGWSPQVGELFV